MKQFRSRLIRFSAIILSAVMLMTGFVFMPETSIGEALSITAYADVATNQVLRKGSRGTAVKQLQQSLNTLGYNAGTVDGIFGNNTYNAVKSFQRANGLTVDGIAGYNTLTAINRKLRERNNKSSVTLSRQRVLTYASRYWNTRNNSYSYYKNNNCANFVSQCLVAGGMPTNSTFRNGTSAFISIPYLKNYLVKTYGVQYISRPSAANIQVGDILYTSSGHVMIVTSKNGSRVYASGNTNNRYNMQISSSYFYAVLKTSTLMK